MKVVYKGGAGAHQASLSRGFAFGARGLRDDQMTDEVKEARKNRRVNARQGMLSRRTAVSGGAGGSGFSDIQFATGRPRDPLFYWRQNNLPYDFSQNEELAKVRAFCRLLYQTDPIVGSCVDIFSKFPVIGAHLECKDNRLEEFYSGLFFDEEGLDYEEFMVDIGREYYTAGEAWPFATFNEDLGIWDDEELLNSDDIKVERSPFLKEPRYFTRLPWTIRQILTTRQPAWEYNKLVQEYPELAAYTAENAFMPVSNVLLQQLRFKGDTFNLRGLPLLTRAMRSMLQQEMLNTAMDSIADRLYTPLILCKLGASATDLGTSVPWIPTDDDLENFELALDAALAGDFRALIHNFAVDIQPVFGRENMPDLTPDFERIEDRVLQVFGLSRTFLTGAGGGETYAADALNKQLVEQLMTRYQKYLKRHFHRRAVVVAEAQEHYDYEERNGRRFVLMEEVLEIDEETGERHITEQPKLLVPKMEFSVLNFQDKDTVRQFTESLRASGMPISARTRSRGLAFDLDEERERSQDEAVADIIAQARTRRQAFVELRKEGLPVPIDLMADFAPKAQEEGVPPALAAQQMMIDRMGVTPPTLPDLAPTPDDMAMAQDPEAALNAPPEGDGPQPGEEDAGMPQRPPESDEQRDGMPVAAARRKGQLPKQGALFRRAERVRRTAALAREIDDALAPSLPRVTVAAADGTVTEVPGFRMESHHPESEAAAARGEGWTSGPSLPAYQTPAHVGIRGRLGVTEDDSGLLDYEKYAPAGR
ncbi:MAG: hypothetical protein JWM19_927 [Actinomycetia bacterium]|nr:hypothetical protein [Actinomycetes bacterium]